MQEIYVPTCNFVTETVTLIYRVDVYKRVFTRRLYEWKESLGSAQFLVCVGLGRGALRAWTLSAGVSVTPLGWFRAIPCYLRFRCRRFLVLHMSSVHVMLSGRVPTISS